MKKSKTLRVRQDFVLSHANYAAWAADVAASVLPFFVSKESNQTPALAVSKSVGKKQRRALMRAFKKQRERVTITASIPRAARCVAADLIVVRSACARCGQPAKDLDSRYAFFLDGRRVEFGGMPRKTIVPCPACGYVAEEARVQGPATHLNEKSGSGEPLLSEIDSL